MRIEHKLRKLQDALRNAGWRIRHIPWQPDGKPEYFVPRDPVTKVLLVLGLVCFLGGIPLNQVSIPLGIGTMLLGLAALFASRFSMGYFAYRSYVPVRARCIDREIIEYEDPDSIDSLIKTTYWAPRVLCEYEHDGHTHRVTPIIPRVTAFATRQGVERFLAERIGPGQACTLWVNPDNPLQTILHKRPWMAYHG